jgi:hypothetical protein
LTDGSISIRVPSAEIAGERRQLNFTLTWIPHLLKSSAEAQTGLG